MEQVKSGKKTMIWKIKETQVIIENLVLLRGSLDHF